MALFPLTNIDTNQTEILNTEHIVRISAITNDHPGKDSPRVRIEVQFSSGGPSVGYVPTNGRGGDDRTTADPAKVLDILRGFILPFERLPRRV